jgi:preprotein translocase subunit SecD
VRRHPGRVLTAFVLIVAVLYALAAVNGDWTPKLGLDLQGGTRITLQAQTDNGDQVTEEKLAEARDIIESRVNGTGVAEAEVTSQGGDQIIVEVPGQESQELVEQVGRTAQLRFRLVWDSLAAGQPTPPQGPVAPQQPPDGGTGNNGANDGGANDSGANDSGANDSGANEGANDGGANDGGANDGGANDSGANDGSSKQRAVSPWMAKAAEDDLDWTKLSLEESIAISQGQPAPKEFADELAALRAELQSFVCPGAEGGEAQVDDVAAEPLLTCDDQGVAYLLSPAVIEGTQLDDASAGLPSQQLEWVVQLDFDGEATDDFATVTRAFTGTGEQFAIVLDGIVLSAPQVESAIVDGNAQISGGQPAFTQTTATELANQLKYGALPLTFAINGVTVEGPTLAGSQLEAGLLAGVIGLGLVLIYTLLYYRGLGLVVLASLVMAAAVLYPLALLLGQSVGFTLTLPGIAGLIVAIGITADSFIVYFERLRDEVRDGRSLRLAVENGWRRARLTILAADAVSILAAVVLYIFAIGVVRGFAFALGLTTLIDIFLVFFFTKPLVSLLARTKFFGQGHPLSGLDAKHLGVTDRPVDQLARGPRAATSGGFP